MFSALNYFGNRGQLQDDLLSLIKRIQDQRKDKKKWRCCYDLFAGSASMSIAIMAQGLAEKYIINDIYAPLSIFWCTVQKNSAALQKAYRSLLDEYLVHSQEDSRQAFYQTQLATFNRISLMDEIYGSPSYAALFAFLINHAEAGIPFISEKKEGRLELNCTLIKKTGKLPIDEVFPRLVKQLYDLFKDKNVEFRSRNFRDYHQEEITADDLVLLDPPYPDMQDAEERPEQHIYHRGEPKSQLQQYLISFLRNLEEKKTSFLMCYGVLGMDNLYPIFRDNHYFRLSGDSNSHFGEYVENLYLSTDIANLLQSTYPPRIIRHDTYLDQLIAKKKDYPEMVELIKEQITEYDKWNKPFHHLFEDQAKDRPLAIALSTFNPEGTIQHETTYIELNQKANQLADYLIKQHQVKKGDVIALLVNGNMPLFIQQILAILKTGAAYLPLDGSHSKDILKETLASAQPRLIWVSDAIANQFDLPCIVMPDADELNAYTTENPESSQQVYPRDLAYIMYTSGSTGKPKGAEIAHQGLPYCLKAHQDMLGLSANDSIAQMAKVGFDASLMEIIMALGTGATLCLIPPAVRDDNQKLIKVFKEQTITQAIFVPSKLQSLQPHDFPNLKGMIVTGEPFTESLIQPWYAAGKCIVNGYGLTETTICTTLGKYEGQGLHIGQAIMGTKIYLAEIKDEEVVTKLTLLKGGEEGEICVSGLSVAKGYRYDEKRSKERFIVVEDPHTQQLVRVYRSGDSARYADQDKKNFIITGRIDNQIKLRGQRLEPEHIEEKIKIYPGIQNACVVGIEKKGHKHLVAYIEWKDGLKSKEEESIRLGEVKYFIQKQLPHFMVPNAWASLEKLPENRNGKINRNVLKVHRPIPFLRTYKKETLITTQERALAELWREKLGNNQDDAIKRHDDFFSLGGSSTLVTCLLEAIRRDRIHFPYADQLTPEEIYQNSTLKSMARRASFKPLCCLHQGEKSAASLYLVHSLLGDGWNEYTALVEGLKQSKSSIYAFKAYGLSQERNFDDTLEELASDYVERLLREEKASPKQPIVIAGWSSGGVMAYAMVKELIARGYRARLILIDSFFPQKKKGGIIKIYTLMAEKIFGKKYANKVESTLMQLNKEIVDFEEIHEALSYLQEIDDKEKLKQWEFAHWLLKKEYQYIEQISVISPAANSAACLPKAITFFSSEQRENRDWDRYIDSDEKKIVQANHFDIIAAKETLVAIENLLNTLSYESYQQKLIDRVRTTYEAGITVKRFLSEEVWIANETTYIPVTLVDHREIAVRETQISLEQNKEEISNTREREIDFTKWFKDDKKENNRILIQGAAGSGKTLLSKYLIQQWARHKLWPMVACVFHLSLRDLSLKSIQDLAHYDSAVICSVRKKILIKKHKESNDEKKRIAVQKFITLSPNITENLTKDIKRIESMKQSTSSGSGNFLGMNLYKLTELLYSPLFLLSDDYGVPPHATLGNFFSYPFTLGFKVGHEDEKFKSAQNHLMHYLKQDHNLFIPHNNNKPVYVGLESGRVVVEPLHSKDQKKKQENSLAAFIIPKPTGENKTALYIGNKCMNLEALPSVSLIGWEVEQPPNIRTRTLKTPSDEIKSVVLTNYTTYHKARQAYERWKGNMDATILDAFNRYLSLCNFYLEAIKAKKLSDLVYVSHHNDSEAYLGILLPRGYYETLIEKFIQESQNLRSSYTAEISSKFFSSYTFLPDNKQNNYELKIIFSINGTNKDKTFEVASCVIASISKQIVEAYLSCFNAGSYAKPNLFNEFLIVFLMGKAPLPGHKSCQLGTYHLPSYDPEFLKFLGLYEILYTQTELKKYIHNCDINATNNNTTTIHFKTSENVHEKVKEFVVNILAHADDVKSLNSKLSHSNHLLEAYTKYNESMQQSSKKQADESANMDQFCSSSTMQKQNAKEIKQDLSSDAMDASYHMINNRAQYNEKQLGWNCFDLAVGIEDRAAFVKYALAHAEEEEYRLLLAPEIRHAAALTAIYMNIKAEEKRAEKEKIERILELFHIAEAVRGLEEEKLIKDELIAVLKSEAGDDDSLRLHALPLTMHTEELQEILNSYLKAHEAMRGPVAVCNQALGKKEGEYFSLEELDQFFKNEAHRNQHKEAYTRFARARRTKLEPYEKELDNYCQDIDTYKQYVSEYYGKQEWFAFQRGLSGEQPSTSMIDIAARYLAKEIIIQQKTNDQQEEVYRTAACGESITIEYQNNNHFEQVNFSNSNIADKEYGLNNFPNYDIAVSKNLAAIEQENNDSKPLGDIDITRGKVSDAISSENNYYTADFINLLLYHFNQEAGSIKAYPATTIDQIKEYFEKICSQDKDYAFIPLNVAFDEESPQHENHWVALIIDKRHQLIFYLDPEKTAKTVIPTQIEDLRIALNYQNEIIMNSIDFQQKEKQEGWIRHCGAYVVEIFNIFLKSIQDGKCISGGQLANIDIDGESISLQTALSAIPCGEAEAILKIRKNHIKDAREILEVDLKESEVQSNQPQSFESLGNYLGHVPNLSNKIPESMPKDFSSETLLGAAKKGDLKAMKWLLANGSSISQKDELGNTVMLVAAFGGYLDVVRWLLANGSSLSEKDNNGITALLWAAYGGRLEVVRWLLSNGSSLSEKDNNDMTALLWATDGGHLELVSWLLANGSSLSEKDNNGRTALLGAAWRGHLEVVRWLLSNGSSISEKDNNGMTALLCAADGGHLELVCWLLANGSSLNEKDNNGRTALLCAADGGHLELVCWLLANGSSLNEKDNNGRTALLLAAYGGHLEVVRLLLDHGASLSEKDKYGRTALDLASKPEVKEFLRSYQPLTQLSNNPSRLFGSQSPKPAPGSGQRSGAFKNN